MSAVVPTHDTRDLTLRCVTSLAPLAARGAEVIVVDDGSADGTADALRRAFAWVRVIVNAKPQGFARSANLGLSAAGGSLLLLLNSDTEVDASTFDRLIEAFEADEKLGAGGASLTYPDGTPQWSGGRLPTRVWLTAMASGLPALLATLPGYRRLRPPAGAGGEAEWVTGAAMAIRRDAWTQVGPLDESFAFYGQDLDFCDRLRRAGWHVRLVPGWRVMHVGGATIGRAPGSMGGVRNPSLLWSDLLLWASRAYGPSWTSRTARLMSAAATARLAARWLGRPFQGASRDEWDRDTASLRQARAAARAWSSGDPLRLS